MADRAVLCAGLAKIRERQLTRGDSIMERRLPPKNGLRALFNR
jgi:hypothetical protein